MKREIKKTKGDSYIVGDLPKGCEYCIEGSKVVIFITGKCSRKCFYCPISTDKKNSDKVYADEIMVENDADLLRETQLIDAKGAGLTGGDPVLAFDKTLKYLKLLKNTFGEKFHIHLYTTGNELTSSRVDKLIKSGLDEIRFHTEDFNLTKLNLLKNTKIDHGCEIPAIPGKEKDVIDLIKLLEKDKIDFININELEFSETNSYQLKKRGYILKEDSIAAVKGSEETALKILNWAKDNTEFINIHYCPSRLKDGIQLKNRFLRRAKNVKKTYEEFDEEGLLLRGVFHIEKELKLEDLKNILIKEYEVPEKLLDTDIIKNQITTTWYIAKELASELKKINVKTEIVKSFPTDDRFIVYSYYIN